jgi:hypothetical protein
MGAIVLGFLVLVFFVILAALKGGVAGSYDRLASAGLRGRALVLGASQMVTGVTLNGRRFQRRQMVLEIEIEGREPYEVSGTFLVPRGLIEPIPGSSLDVAVDRGVPSRVAVLGPGGFSGPWLRTGIPQPY